MAIVMVLEVPGASTEQYDQVNEAIGVYSSADAPDGLISHVCAVTDKGLVICDVWSSQEELESFIESKIGPAMLKAGLYPDPPRFGQLHHQLGKRG
jgi:hypothetical protein